MQLLSISYKSNKFTFVLQHKPKQGLSCNVTIVKNENYSFKCFNNIGGRCDDKNCIHKYFLLFKFFDYKVDVNNLNGIATLDDLKQKVDFSFLENQSLLKYLYDEMEYKFGEINHNSLNKTLYSNNQTFMKCQSCNTYFIETVLIIHCANHSFMLCPGCNTHRNPPKCFYCGSSRNSLNSSYDLNVDAIATNFEFEEKKPVNKGLNPGEPGGQGNQGQGQGLGQGNQGQGQGNLGFMGNQFNQGNPGNPVNPGDQGQGQGQGNPINPNANNNFINQEIKKPDVSHISFINKERLFINEKESISEVTYWKEFKVPLLNSLNHLGEPRDENLELLPNYLNTVFYISPRTDRLDNLFMKKQYNDIAFCQIERWKVNSEFKYQDIDAKQSRDKPFKELLAFAVEKGFVDVKYYLLQNLVFVHHPDRINYADVDTSVQVEYNYVVAIQVYINDENFSRFTENLSFKIGEKEIKDIMSPHAAKVRELLKYLNYETLALSLLEFASRPNNITVEGNEEIEVEAIMAQNNTTNPKKSVKFNDTSEIKVDLKPHQLIALYKMLDFEYRQHAHTAHPFIELLWRKDIAKMYKNSEDKEKFKKAKSLNCYNGYLYQTSWKNNNYKGFLLCDDMGLGKTITTLALVYLKQSLNINKLQYTDFKNTKTHAKYFETISYKPNDPININKQYGKNLIVVPYNLLKQWYAEVDKFVKTGVLRKIMYHDANTRKLYTVKDLINYDLVITTYEIITQDGKNQGPLSKIHWYRIVLDEAHKIKNDKSINFHSLLQLQCFHKVILTGTPIQNTVDEMYSYMKMVDYNPFNYKPFFNALFSRLYNKGNDQKTLALKVFGTYIQRIMIRRTKDASIDGLPIIQIPPKTINIVFVKMEGNSKHVYDILFENTAKEVKRILDEETNGMMGILQLIIRLRQCCNHIKMVEGKVELNSSSNFIALRDWLVNHYQNGLLFNNRNAMGEQRVDEKIDKIKETFMNNDTCAHCKELLDTDTSIVLECGHVQCLCLYHIDTHEAFKIECMDPHCDIVSSRVFRLNNNHVDLDVNVNNNLQKADNQRNIEHIDINDLNENVAENLEANKHTNGNTQQSNKDNDTEADASSLNKKVRKNKNIFEQEDQLEFNSGEKFYSIQKFANDTNPLIIERKDIQGLVNSDSTKVDRIIELVKEILNRKEKVIIFSQFSSFTCLIGKTIKKELNVPYRNMHGKVKGSDRVDYLEDFKECSNVNVLLLTYGVGGVGLNLNFCSNVILADLWWNPSIEEQAIDRCHRMGQDKPVNVYKMIVLDSIEEKIVKLQEKKKKMRDDFMQGKISKEPHNVLTKQDIRDMFNLRRN